MPSYVLQVLPLQLKHGRACSFKARANYDRATPQWLVALKMLARACAHHSALSYRWHRAKTSAHLVYIVYTQAVSSQPRCATEFIPSKRQITLRIVGYHISSRLTATLNLCPIYLKLLVPVL